MSKGFEVGCMPVPDAITVNVLCLRVPQIEHGVPPHRRLLRCLTMSKGVECFK
jgi:hypothetical protein